MGTLQTVPTREARDRPSRYGFVYAPVVMGAEAGFAHLCIDGKSVGKIPLIYGETIEQIPEKEKNFWDKIIGRD